MPKAPRLSINVTDEDIQVAIPRDSGHCMIADAIRRQIPWARSISVDLQTIRMSNPETGFRYYYLTPRIAQEALVAFDQGDAGIIKPISFGLQVAQIKKMFVRSEAKKIARKAKLTPVGGSREVPTKLEGRAPPHAALSDTHGKRRTFGLRALRY